jgi:hypothetical protein
LFIILGREFDLFFAPASTRRKFNRYGSDHFVSHDLTNAEERDATDRWTKEIVNLLADYDGGAVSRSSEISQLWPVLDPDPKALPRLLRLRELAKKLQPNSSVIGALDLMAGTVSDPEEAIPEKRRLITSVIASASLAPQSEALQILQAISARLSNSAFRNAAAPLADVLEKAVAKITEQDPERALLSLSYPVAPGVANDQSPFLRGIARGFSESSLSDNSA